MSQFPTSDPKLWLRRLLALCAAGLMILSAVCFRPASANGLLAEGLVFFLLGGMALGGAVFLGGAVIPPPAAPRWRPAASPARATGWRWLPGLAGLALLIEINGGFLGVPALVWVHPRAQFALLAVTLGLLAWAAGGRLTGAGRGSLRIETLLLLGITLLALALRLADLGTAVHHFVDEIHFSTAVAGLLPGSARVRLLEPFGGITAFPWLYPYWQSEVVLLWGRTLGALRVVSAVIGTLGVPALYLLAQTLFDRRTALIAALLLAVFPPHLHFSRIGLNNIADPLVGTLLLAFLARGIRHGRRADWALAGLFLGLTQYFYEGGRLLYPPLALAWLAVWWVSRPRSAAAGTGGAARGHLLAFGLAALLVALPIYTTLLANGKPLLPRMQTVAVGGSYWQRVMAEGSPQSLAEHLLLPFLVYVSVPEQALFYGGEQPLMIEAAAPLFMLGVFALLWRFDRAGIWLLLWLLFTSMGNMVMTESAIYARYVVAFPAAALALAVGIRQIMALLRPLPLAAPPALPPAPNRLSAFGCWVWDWLPLHVVVHLSRQDVDDQPRPHSTLIQARVIVRLTRRDLSPLLALLLALLLANYYFNAHLPTYNLQIRPYFDSEDAMFRAADLPAGTMVHVFSANTPGMTYLAGVLGYLADGLRVEVVIPEDLTPAYLEGLPPETGHAFFVEPRDFRTLGLLSRHFDLGPPHLSPYGVPEWKQLALFYVPPAAGG